MVKHGNPVVWGMLGWIVLAAGILLGVCFCFKYLRKCHKMKLKKEQFIKEKEKCRTQIERLKLEQEAVNEKRRALKQKLEEEEKHIFGCYLSKSRKVNLQNIREEIVNLNREKDNLLTECNKTQDEIEKNDVEIDNIDNQLKRSRKKFFAHKKRKGAILSMILVIGFADRHNMVVAAQEISSTLHAVFENEDVVEEFQTEEPVKKDEEQKIEERDNEILLDVEDDLRDNLEYNFILEEEQLKKKLDNDIVDIIFLANYSKDNIGYEDFLSDCREGNIEEKLLKVIIEEDNDEEYGIKGLLNEIAENMEKPFLTSIQKGKLIQTRTEWEESGPKSSELEKIINKRIKALKMEESISVRRTIYYRLANDYQRMGDECLIQGKNGAQIYYYYGMSIYCCYCALRYEASGENGYSDSEILNYAKARYKDIMDNEKMGISKNIIDNAMAIYSLIK